jgi:hypothetical protein
MYYKLLAIVLVVLPISLNAAQNAGLVQGIWYEREPVFADEEVRVFVAIQNNTGSELTGTVQFRVDDELIGEQTVTAQTGRLIEAAASWTPTYGTSTVTATLLETNLADENASSTPVSVAVAAATATRFVDRDTDGDGTGDQTDTDDDNDGILDEDDAEPLVYNEPEPESGAASADEDTSNSDNEGGSSQSTRTGLEQFVTHEPTEHVLGVMTDTINRTKEQLDDYRAARASARAADEPEKDTEEPAPDDTATTTTEETATEESDDGFGTITRSHSEEGPGFFTAAWQLITTLLDRGYTLLLFVLSVYLGHPAIVQLTLLFLILFILFKLARRLSHRPI